MSIPATKIKELLPKELKEEYTDEFVLLGLFYFAKKYGYNLGRMQTAKLLWKFKSLIQQKLGLQAYYTEPYKDKHGRFNKEIYPQLNDLKTADFIQTLGSSPLEKFIISPRGEKVFNQFTTEEEKTKYALELAKSHLDFTVREHGEKSTGLLREEDHNDIDGIDKLPERDEDNILCPNLKPEEIKHKFLFNDEETLDWAVAISIGERKKSEEIVSEELLPKNQEETYKALGL